MFPAVNNNKDYGKYSSDFFFPLKETSFVLQSFNFGSLWHYGGLDSFKQQKQTIMYAFDALHKLISFFFNVFSLISLQSRHPRGKSLQLHWTIAAWMFVGRLRLIGPQAAL